MDHEHSMLQLHSVAELITPIMSFFWGRSGGGGEAACLYGSIYIALLETIQHQMTPMT
jgi:hypothetical protein